MPTPDQETDALYQGMFFGGTSMSDGGKALQLSIKQIHDLANVAATKTDLNGAVLNLAADNLNKFNTIMAKLNEIEAKLP